MPWHWCPDETLALFSALPFIGYFFAKLHAWWHQKFHHPCHTDGCQNTHVDHVELTEAYNPGNDWDELTQDDAMGRFGYYLVDDLMCDTELLKVEECPADKEFTWFINGFGSPKAKFQGRTFTIDDVSQWYEIK